MLEAGPTPEAEWEGQIWMHPDPPIREGLALDGLVAAPLAKRYEEALEAYRAGMWTFAAQGARAALEGLVLRHLGAEPNDKRGLAVLLDALAKTDLGKPITDAGAVVRVGGNRASHYSDEDFDEATARAVLDLLDAFFEYLVIVPHETERARRILEGDRGP